MTTKPLFSALIIHGGCSDGDLKDPVEAAHLSDQEKGLEEIINKGWRKLKSGATALDAVEYTINLLEDHPQFNAGIGAAIGAERQIELDASIMDGKDLRCGAVAGLQNFQNAISVAKAVMEKTSHVFLAADGANLFARNQGFKETPIEKFYTPYQEHWWSLLDPNKQSTTQGSKGTVGAVAIDDYGNIAAGTSTGGMTRKMPGRIGDSPIIGAGTYADSRIAGISATGWGEQIIRCALAKRIVDLIEIKSLSANEAAKSAILEMEKMPNGQGGVIVIDTKGEVAAFSNTKWLPHAWMKDTQDQPVVKMSVIC